MLLATLGDPAAAELCAARLRAEGIVSHLRGEALGPYRLTVGRLAEIEVWVPERRLDEARALLADAEGEPTLAPEAPAEPEPGGSEPDEESTP